MTQANTTHPSLLLRLRDRQDAGSWQDFHSRYAHLLYRYARARGATHADAEDVAQDVLLQFLRSVDRFSYDPRKGRFRAYLRIAVIHELGRRSRRTARQPRGLDPTTFDVLAAEREAEGDESWRTEWQLSEVRWAVERIAGEFDPVTLKAFEMHVLAGRPAAETADELGISKWRVYRGRQRILRSLAIEMQKLPDEPEAAPPAAAGRQNGGSGRNGEGTSPSHDPGGAGPA